MAAAAATAAAGAPPATALAAVALAGLTGWRIARALAPHPSPAPHWQAANDNAPVPRGLRPPSPLAAAVARCYAAHA